MEELPRRRFIQVGVGGALVLAFGAGVFRWVSAGYALEPGEVALGLSVKELVVARALVDALVPGQDGMPGGVELRIHQRIDEQVWSAPAGTADDLRAAFELLEHVPPLFGYAGRFSALGREARRAMFETMLDSRRDLFVAVAVALKQLTQLLYYGHDAVWAHIGYDGPWVKERRPPESSLAYERLVSERGGRLA